MEKFLYVLQWIGCGCSLFALTVFLFPSVINYNEGIGWLGLFIVPLYTIVVLILCLISTKGIVKNKFLFTATIVVIVYSILSFSNMFLDFLPINELGDYAVSCQIVFLDVITLAIFIGWIVCRNLCAKKERIYK